MNRVFVSSTFRDLQEHRARAREAKRQLGAADVAMEHFGARENRPKDECSRLIREESDAFVGIYAHRYGFIPEGDDISITESEYREAIRADLPAFVYIVDGDYPWPPAQIERGDSGEKLARFKTELRRDKIVGTFKTPDQLATAVAADLGRHFSEREAPNSEIHGCLHEPPSTWVSPVRRNRWRYRVAAFDLDGTLVRGPDFTFSWEAIWALLGFGSTIQRELKREYRQSARDAVSKTDRIDAYQFWCEKACAHFQSRQLTRKQLSDLSRTLNLTKHCRDALAELREAGVTTAIISGGVNTFLEDTFPDYREYVDFVFMNELLFSDAGDLEGVRATAYDFEGKADALENVCERVGCTSGEAVFVGDRFNDEAVMLRVDKAIAYPPRDAMTADVSNEAIDEDDLRLILPHILVE